MGYGGLLERPSFPTTEYIKPQLPPGFPPARGSPALQWYHDDVVEALRKDVSVRYAGTRLPGAYRNRGSTRSDSAWTWRPGS